jgi:hypothetical protein
MDLANYCGGYYTYLLGYRLVLLTNHSHLLRELHLQIQLRPGCREGRRTGGESMMEAKAAESYRCVVSLRAVFPVFD